MVMVISGMKKNAMATPWMMVVGMRMVSKRAWLLKFERIYTGAMATSPAPGAKGSPRSLSGLLPFLKPYRGRIALAGVFLVMAAAATLVFPVALRSLIDGGLSTGDKGTQLLALREHFLELFAVAVAT